MDRNEAAARLDGCEYGSEGSSELFAEMKKARLVAFFGSSDDLIEMRGAIHDETGPGKVRLTPEGLLSNDCRNDACPYFARLSRYASTVVGEYGQDGWTMSTDLPHSAFVVLEDGETYCRGVVLSLDEVP
jgi:hypothetical protein